MHTTIFGFCALLFSLSISGQIVSGPMLGNNTMREVHIWLQLDREAEVQLRYASQDEPEDLYYSEPVVASFDKAFTATLVAHGLQPGTTYRYDVLVNEEVVPLRHDLQRKVSGDAGLQPPSYTFTTQTLWQYRTAPPNFSFLVGSCLYTNDSSFDRPGRPYGRSSDTLFQSMTSIESEFMLWLGDNIYLRTPDFDSKTGIYHRYTDYKSKKYLHEFWSSRHHYAIWDDHDFGPNNSDGSYLYKDLTREAFKDFWANPTYGRKEEGIHTAFRWSDCYFVLLDNRYFRDPNNMPGSDVSILGAEQLEWFKQQLISAKGSFIFVAVGGQLLNPSKMYENHANYEKERDEIIRFIQDNDIKNVIFLTGDRHRTELSKLEKEGAPTIYDLTCSPLSSRSYAERAPENNTLRLEGTEVSEQNFGHLSIKGEQEDRQIEIEIFDTAGSRLWNRTIKAE